MKVISPTFEVRTPFGPLTPEMGIQMLKFIEWNARISHRSEEAQTEDSWQRFIQSVVLDHGDMSVLEHASLTVLFEVNRGVTHELVRHRLFGFTQESTRFVNYTSPKHEPVFIPSVSVREQDRAEWEADLAIAEEIYKKWLSRKYAPQIARDHLPNALGAQISVTGNLRNWRHAMLMRTSRETHPDFRAVTIPLLGELQRCIPLLYADIIPNERQIDNLKKAR